MATTDTLAVFKPLGFEVPAANYPAFSVRNNQPILLFDQTTDEECYWTFRLPRHYAGGGITVSICWSTTGTTGAARWEAAFERHQDETDDLDADSFATAQSAGGTAPATSGMVQYTEIAFTNGQIDGLLVGEEFRFMLRRDANGTTGTDDLAADAEVRTVELRET